MVPLAVVFLIIMTPLYEPIVSDATSLIAFQIISGCVGVLGAIAGMVIFFGMFAYLFLCDGRSSKLLWAAFFLLTGCFGSAIYFLAACQRPVFRGVDSPTI
jgi:NADH:ubiquinone oxidoreductase subunit 4 (subunit M)